MNFGIVVRVVSKKKLIYKTFKGEKYNQISLCIKTSLYTIKELKFVKIM